MAGSQPRLCQSGPVQLWLHITSSLPLPVWMNNGSNMKHNINPIHYYHHQIKIIIITKETNVTSFLTSSVGRLYDGTCSTASIWKTSLDVFFTEWDVTGRIHFELKWWKHVEDVQDPPNDITHTPTHKRPRRKLLLCQITFSIMKEKLTRWWKNSIQSNFINWLELCNDIKALF